MTRDWKNIYLDYHIHHITGTVHQWQPILLCPPIIELFYTEYNRLTKTYNIATLGYVVMPEHFHVLVSSSKGDGVERFLQGFRRSVSGKVRWIIERGGEAVLGSPSDRRIDPLPFYRKTAGKSEFRFWKEKPRVFAMNHLPAIQKKLDYIHLNPVRRGLVERAEDWPHSSAKAHLFGEEGRIAISFLPEEVG